MTIIIIFIIIGGAGLLFYGKYKKTNPDKPQEKLDKDSKLYEKRVSGSLSKE